MGIICTACLFMYMDKQTIYTNEDIIYVKGGKMVTFEMSDDTLYFSNRQAANDYIEDLTAQHATFGMQSKYLQALIDKGFVFARATTYAQGQSKLELVFIHPDTTFIVNTFDVNELLFNPKTGQYVEEWYNIPEDEE